MNRKSSLRWTLLAAIVALLVAPIAAQAQGVVFVTNNRLGVGTDVPTAKAHVKSDDAQVLVENDNATAGTRALVRAINKGASLFRFDNTNTGANWNFGGGNADSVLFSRIGTPTEFQIFNGGNATLAGTLTEGSSRSIKKDIETIDGREVLARVAELPIAKWTYQADATGARHLGPMAEDFHAAFGLGSTDKGIASLDGSGVALAAIQGLKAELEDRDDRIQQLEEKLALITETLEEMAASQR